MASDKIREELLGSRIQTRKFPSTIFLEQSEECVKICKDLGLDVFQAKEKAEPKKPEATKGSKPTEKAQNTPSDDVSLS